MRFLAFLLLGLAVATLASPYAALTESQHQFLFTKWVQQHGKSYEANEFFQRFSVFKSNMEKILVHNAGNSSYSLGMNEFGDLTWEEFRGRFVGGYRQVKRNYLRSLNEPEVAELPVQALPTSVDWRQKNAVTEVKNQGQCGSCWAFSTTGSTEGAWAIAGKGLVSLSEQQLVDCSSSYGNQGCNGGLMDQGFEYIISKGICTEKSYPYTAQDGTCKSSCEKVVKLSGYKDVPQNNDAALQTAAASGPVSVAIEADQEVFQFYSGGVLDDSGCGTNLDHGVLIVGYGTDAGKNYWTVKNSWGGSWGESGYIRLARGKNECGINTSASYPVV